VYYCPGGKMLTTTGTRVNDDTTLLYRASKHDCAGCVRVPDDRDHGFQAIVITQSRAS
jgi:hypothetical protein